MSPAGSGATLVDCLETEAAYFEIGNEITETPWARLIRNRTTPEVWDSNCAVRVRARSSEEVQALLRAMDGHYDWVRHRSVKVDPETPAAVEARLLQEGFSVDAMLHLVLGPAAPVRSERALLPAHRIRAATGDQDWEDLVGLARQDHEEMAARRHQPPWSMEVTRQMVQRKRQRSGALPYFLIRRGETAVGYGCAWAGPLGVGLVEDLFTHPEHRGRGLATAMIAHGVAFVRERGAGPVMIGADVDDWPRHLYARLGFVPRFVTRNYVRSA